MRFYNQPHAYYCGIDLHARSMFTHVLDHAGATVFAGDLPASPDAFLHATAPFRQGLIVGCECMFAWYWLADLCEDHAIPFTLGHALYMKAIHGGKAKNDRIDAAKIASLLRGGMFPMWDAIGDTAMSLKTPRKGKACTHHVGLVVGPRTSPARGPKEKPKRRQSAALQRSADHAR